MEDLVGLGSDSTLKARFTGTENDAYISMQLECHRYTVEG